MFIETHAHLTMPEYSDLDEVITRAKNEKIIKIVNASFDLQSSRDSLKLAKNYQDYIFAAIGIHPHDADTVTAASLNEIKTLAANQEVVAIGETGLDYNKNLQSQETQQAAFRKLLLLAQEVGLPVIIHARDAQEDTIRIMQEVNKGNLRGVFHCFAGDDQLIRFASDIGFYISFAGMVTFKKAHNVRENVIRVPLSQLLLETDCPYLAPEPYRGKRNEPSYLPTIARKIAEVKGVTVDEVATETTKNSKELFKI
ncbi:TatD family hydrolase [Candidatus Margulisiibacteriota bacterium]